MSIDGYTQRSFLITDFETKIINSSDNYSSYTYNIVRDINNLQCSVYVPLVLRFSNDNSKCYQTGLYEPIITPYNPISTTTDSIFNIITYKIGDKKISSICGGYGIGWEVT